MTKKYKCPECGEAIKTLGWSYDCTGEYDLETEEYEDDPEQDSQDPRIYYCPECKSEVLLEDIIEVIEEIKVVKNHDM